MVRQGYFFSNLLGNMLIVKEKILVLANSFITEKKENHLTRWLSFWKIFRYYDLGSIGFSFSSLWYALHLAHGFLILVHRTYAVGDSQ